MNAKIYNGNVQPNPKEYKIWVNDEGIIKTWNGTEWIEQSGGSGESGGSGNGSNTINSRAIYYKTVDGIYQDSDIWQNVARSCVSVIKSLRVNPKDNEDKYYIYPSFFVKKDQIVAVCFLPLSKINFGSDEPGTFNSLEDFFEYAYSDEYPFTVDAFVEKRITEEEFYNLND